MTTPPLPDQSDGAVYIVHFEPTGHLYGFPTRVQYPDAWMAQQAAEGLRHNSTWGRVWVEKIEPTCEPPLEGEPCGRLLVGRGADTWDPVCLLPVGHAGPCSDEDDADAPDEEGR